MALPSFVSFFVEQKFLRCVEGSLLKYIDDEEGAASPLTRFAVERFNNEAGLVHLRNCYTNRYWARGKETLTSFILAIAEDRVTDQSSENCTIFRIHIDDQKKVSFVHVQSGFEVGLFSMTGNNSGALKLGDGSSDWVPLETQFFNLESLVKLPKRVVFKGDNGKYVSVLSDGTFDLVLCNSEDAAEPKAQFETYVSKFGHTLIKSLFNDLFCYAKPRLPNYEHNWIMAGVDDEVAHTIYIAWWTILNGPNNTIAIRYEKDGLFWQRQEANGFKDGLLATADSMMSRTLLKVEEPVVNRIIWVDFKLDNARIFDAQPLVSASSTVRNESPLQQQTQLHVSYTKSRTSTWNNTFRTAIGITTTFVTKFAFIAEGKIKTTVELEYQHEWGGSETVEENVSSTPVVNVPPHSIATVMVMATEGKCNIPFSYRQLDELLSGDKVETVLHDGVYDNVSDYDFHIIIRTMGIDSPEAKEIETNQPANPPSRLLTGCEIKFTPISSNEGI